MLGLSERALHIRLIFNRQKIQVFALKTEKNVSSTMN
jgi:hypothetical protein